MKLGTKPSDYFITHCHSEFSQLDGIGSVDAMVKKADDDGRPAMSLTDHGHMAGSLQLYKATAKLGMTAFPGSELYVVTDVNDPLGKEKRWHMGMLALNFDGYKTMVALSSRSYQRDRFHRKPLVDFGDLAELHESGASANVAVSTGCYSGMVIQTLLEHGPSHAIKMTKMMASWFPHTFIELQCHGINEPGYREDDINEALIYIADKTSLPIMLGADAHYCEPHHQGAHDMMKRICYFGDTDDYKFSGGPYHIHTVKEAAAPWPKKIWDRFEEGHGALLDLNTLRMPALDTYKFHVPSVSKTPNKDLRRRCKSGLKDLVSTTGLPKRIETGEQLTEADYLERITEEMHVIATMGFSDYFLIWLEIVEWCYENDAVINARGSVNGCLVAYLLGISNVDPLEWGTSFGRFLSLDRKKPPDIDMDIESRSRDRVIGHIRKKFPTLVGIGTWSKIGITEQEDEYGGEDKGSVFVQYMSAMRRKKGANFNGKVAPRDRGPLNDLAELDARKSMGAHAGGYVLGTDDHPVSDYLATALIASSGTIVTQAPMDDVEDAGYVKLDLLGLTGLETVSDAQKRLGNRVNDWSWIPWDDKAACRLLSSGKTDGIFQFEGWSTCKGAMEMQIKSTMDAVMCLALYRPALMAGGQTQTYLENRGKPKSERPYQLHPFFDTFLDITDGVPVFQEQVMELCAAVGLPYELWNDLMKAVKASNDKIGEYALKTMNRVEPVFIQCCEDSGVPEDDANDVWAAIMGFTDYGFNRAHATSYGHMSYRCAYMKMHKPLEYMESLLSAWAGTKKEPMYITEARRMSIKVARPNINTSGVVWAIDAVRDKTLRKGFTTIHGVGFTAAQSIVDNRPDGGWGTMAELVDSVPARPVSGGGNWKKTGVPNGVLGALHQAGALADFPDID